MLTHRRLIGRFGPPPPSYVVDLECGHHRNGHPMYRGLPPEPHERVWCDVCLRYRKVAGVRTP